MADFDFDGPPGEPDECDRCDSCEVCPANCQSCGMPMTSPGDFGGGDPENIYCIHCTSPDGSLKSYEEALEGMTGIMMQMQGMDRETAGRTAREYMSKMPAWSGH
jgi:hypothetical protein